MKHYWLPDHWDTRIRSAEDYAEKLAYVRMNSLRRKLVANPEDWPYQGQIFELQWYKL